MGMYVVEKREGDLVTHFYAESIQEAQRIVAKIPKSERGSTYPLYPPEVLVTDSEEE